MRRDMLLQLAGVLAMVALSVLLTAAIVFGLGSGAIQ